MTSKSKRKGKTMPLTDFLAGDSKLVTVRGANWSEIVDSEEAEAKPVVIDIGGLPTAPRAAIDIDYSTIPNESPFIAHVANLSFEIDDEKLRRIFGDLNPKAARIIKEGSRSRGIGLVEFSTRENLIEALKRNDREIYGRKVRVNVSDKSDIYQTDGGRGRFDGQRGNRSNTAEERPEMAGTWRRAEPRSDDTMDERPTSGFNRDRQNRNDNGRSNMGNGPRDNKQGGDYGFGYPRGKDDRTGGAAGRDYNRQGQRNRHHDDDNRSNSEADRPRYGGRYSDTRDTRDRHRNNGEIRDDYAEPPRERQRLQLQPRTKPLEDLQPLSGSSSSVNNVAANAQQSNPDDAASSSPVSHQDSPNTEYQQQDSHESEQSTTKSTARGAGASIFGGAKPVDTTAREAEIEKKLQELSLASHDATGETDEKKTSIVQRTSYNRTGDRDTYRNKRSSNDDHRERRDDDGRSSHAADYHHRREYSGGRQYEDEGRRRNDDDHHQRRTATGRYSAPNRRDHDSNRSTKYNQSDRDNERGNNNRPRNNNTSNSNNDDRSSNTPNNFQSDTQLRHPIRTAARRTQQTDDDSHRLELSNKFGMLGDDEDLDNDNENEPEDARSPSVEE